MRNTKISYAKRIEKREEWDRVRRSCVLTYVSWCTLYNIIGKWAKRGEQRAEWIKLGNDELHNCSLVILLWLEQETATQAQQKAENKKKILQILSE